ncbi:hypothetical protein HN51_013342 [Arachis hypogaea]|uniref:Uncharacterized protein n=1 Tax=Arachis hypogaea TaxID=3818 RepID=A0A445DQN8_ARAHY|nr:uncharacterized protein DS421_3g95670 [Arachis hypogaea]RYR65484.1 hypothetical protein Ahy_A03g011413 [Arachis hypogaea]
MLKQKWFVLVFACLLLISPKPYAVEARQLLTIHKKGYYSKGEGYYVSLGVVCKCCDGKDGKCRNSTTLDDACSNLVCKPWKY